MKLKQDNMEELIKAKYLYLLGQKIQMEKDIQIKFYQEMEKYLKISYNL